MRRNVILVMLALASVLLVIGCSSNQAPAGDAVSGADDVELSNDLSELDDLDALSADLEGDFGFEELDNLEFE